MEGWQSDLMHSFAKAAVERPKGLNPFPSSNLGDIMELLTTTQSCRVHKSHSPHSHQNHMHHILPKSLGGKSESNNLIAVCPTGHYNIHIIIDEWMRGGDTPSWEFLKHFGNKERYWAEAAHTAYKNL